MRVIEMDYGVYLEAIYPHKQKLRDLGDCTIWYDDGRLTIILDDFVHRRICAFAYDSIAEANKDIEVVMNIDHDGGDASSGAPAWLNPAPPTRAAGFAQPVPARRATE